MSVCRLEGSVSAHLLRSRDGFRRSGFESRPTTTWMSHRCAFSELRNRICLNELSRRQMEVPGVKIRIGHGILRRICSASQPQASRVSQL